MASRRDEEMKKFTLGFVTCLFLVVSLGAEPQSKTETLDELLRQVQERTTATEQKTRAVYKKSVKLLQRLKTGDLAKLKDVGIAGSKNFTVIAPVGDFFCEKVLAQAERFRKQIALAQLGQELPGGREFTHINVELSSDKDEGLTLLCGEGRRFSGDHRIWLTTTRQLALGSTLAHEIAHVVLNAQFPRGMPAWANEGIASQFDDDKSKAIRKRILKGFVRTGQWPSVQNVLDARRIHPTDQTAYAVSVSLVEFILARADRKTFLKFIDDGNKIGWEAALRKHYQIFNVQKDWQSWVSSNYRKKSGQ